MLTTLRGGAAGIFAHIMLGLLVIAFVMWGVGDMLRVRAAQSIATVGGQDLPLYAFEHEYRGAMDRLREQLGPRATPELLASLGLARQVADRQIRAELLRRETQALGMLPDDATVAKAIRDDKNFQDKQGHFDRQILEEVLRRNGIREAVYADDVRMNMGKALLQQGLSTPALVDDVMASVLYAAEHELRTVDLVVLSPAALPLPAAPDQTTLEAFYKEQVSAPATAAGFMEPERRTLSYVYIPPDMFKGEDADKALAAFSAKLQDAIAAGSTLAEAAKPLGLTAKTLEPMDSAGHTAGGGWPKDLPDWGNFIQTAFALEEGGQSKLTKIPGKDAYYLVQADKIEPEHPRAFEKVRPQLAAQWQAQERQKQLHAKAEAFAHDLAAAKDEAAQRAVLAEQKLEFVSSGPLSRTSEKAESGQALPPTLIKDIFSRPMHGATGLYPAGDKYIVAVVRSRAPGPSGGAAELKTFKEKLADSERQEVLGDYLYYLYDKYAVTVHQQVLDAYSAPAS